MGQIFVDFSEYPNFNSSQRLIQKNWHSIGIVILAFSHFYLLYLILKNEKFAICYKKFAQNSMLKSPWQCQLSVSFFESEFSCTVLKKVCTETIYPLQIDLNLHSAVFERCQISLSLTSFKRLEKLFQVFKYFEGHVFSLQPLAFTRPSSNFIKM